MSAKTFVDTNILVYSHDRDDRSKQDIARAELRALWSAGTGVVSPQVLQEFYVTVTRKIANRLAKDSARRVVMAYAVWCVDVVGAALRRTHFRRFKTDPPGAEVCPPSWASLAPGSAGDSSLL
jgi:predicted nucleic acid-binding protein